MRMRRSQSSLSAHCADSLALLSTRSREPRPQYSVSRQGGAGQTPMNCTTWDMARRQGVWGSSARVQAEYKQRWPRVALSYCPKGLTRLACVCTSNGPKH